MKCNIWLMALVIIICFNPLQADNRVMILTDTIYTPNAEIVVGFENDTTLETIMNGYRISTSGDISAWFIPNEFIIDTNSRGGTLPDAFWWQSRYAPEDSPNPDSVLCGNNWVPMLPGLIAGDLEPIYHLRINIVGDDGLIYIDSCTNFPPGGMWIWDDGHGNVNPTFNNDNGTHTIVYTYLCGDANRDGLVNVSDAVRLKNYIFVGGAAPNPYEAGDVNCDGYVNVSDIVWILNFIFNNGRWPCDTNGDGVPDC